MAPGRLNYERIEPAAESFGYLDLHIDGNITGAKQVFDLRLAANAALNEYIVHTGTGIFACSHGVQTGGSWSNALFA